MRGTESKTGIVRSEIDVKSWMERVPEVEAVRPGQCPWCEGPSRPAGAPLGIVGHGLRGRQQWGPLEPGGEPAMVEVRVRRFLCLACDGLITVVPRGVVRKRLYSGAAIALALALFGVLRLSRAEVRRRVSPHRTIGYTAATTWAALRRWTRAVQAGRLFRAVRQAPEAWSCRQLAERAATTLAALALPSAGAIEARAFAGGARMA